MFGDDGPPVLLLHGGGQTRHAWGSTGEHARARRPRSPTRSTSAAMAIPNGSRTATTRSRISPPMRGCCADTLTRAHRRATGRDRRLARRHRVAARRRQGRSGAGPGRCSPRWCWSTSRRASISSGVAKVQGFMRAHANEGFASIAEAADAVAAYLPHRPRPRSHEGLKKNLRLHPDGRWRWHWDPRFLDGSSRVRAGSPARSKPALVDAAKAHHASRRCWCAAAPPNWCRRRTPRNSSNWCRMPTTSTSPTPATWWLATAMISSPMRCWI